MKIFALVLAFLCIPAQALAQDTAEVPEDTDMPEEEILKVPFFFELPAGTRIIFDEDFRDFPVPAMAFSLESPELDGGITKIPAGSYVILSRDDGWAAHKVPGKSWLMPDSFYRSAVTKARQLEICQPALDKITETSLAWQQRSYTALETCESQFDSDEELIQDLTGTVQRMEERALLAEKRLSRARTTAGVAIAVTSGVVLGVVAAGIVAASAN